MSVDILSYGILWADNLSRIRGLYSWRCTRCCSLSSACVLAPWTDTVPALSVAIFARIVARGSHPKRTIIFISRLSRRETHLICRHQLIKSQLAQDGSSIIAINLCGLPASATPVAGGYSSPPPEPEQRRQYPLTPAPSSAPEYPTDTGWMGAGGINARTRASRRSRGVACRCSRVWRISEAERTPAARREMGTSAPCSPRTCLIALSPRTNILPLECTHERARKDRNAKRNGFAVVVLPLLSLSAGTRPRLAAQNIT